MKKKIISIFALCLCVCLLFTGCDSVTSILSGENETVEYKIENGEATVVSVPNKSTVTKIVIPNEYEGVPVTKIADFAAVNLEYVTEISIGKNVKEIGSWALENNQKLKIFVIDKENPYFCTVDGAIYTKDMKTLLFCPPATTEHTVPDGVEIIRTKAFYKCGNLTKVSLPDSVKSIEEKAFFRCGAITEIDLPENLEFIGKDVFAYCTGLTEVTIPPAIRQIDEYAFYNCTSLLTVNVNANESELTLGEKWYPTNNGLEINELVIQWAK